MNSALLCDSKLYWLAVTLLDRYFLCACKRVNWFNISSAKHICHVLCFIIYIFAFPFICWEFFYFLGARGYEMDPVVEYGLIGAPIVFIIHCVPFLYFLHFLPCSLGLIFYNSFPGKVQLKYPISSVPFVCFRVVTRGDYPQMVQENVVKHLILCQKVGLTKFVIEIVTQKAFHVPDHPNIRQTIVPESYQTKSGILYKARSLQYCLENWVNVLKKEDWIVHLDEDTLMTEDSVHGIVNFCTSGRHPFGQGTVMYIQDKMVNWLTTYLNSYRVTEDFGRLKLQSYLLGSAVFGLKGSFVVVRADAEKRLGWDNGEAGAIVDDTYFAMKTRMAGYRCGFIEGQMHEMPALTMGDYIRQRSRWFRGLYLACHCKKIPFLIRLPHLVIWYSWASTPFVVVKICLDWAMPLPGYWCLEYFVAMTGAIHIYTSTFGAIKQFNNIFPFATTLVGILLSLAPVMAIQLLSESLVAILGTWAILKGENGWHVTEKAVNSELAYGTEMKGIKNSKKHFDYNENKLW